MQTKKYKYIIEDDSSDIRLDHFMLEQFPKTSRNKLQKAIKDKLILVNDKKVKTGYMLKVDDVIVYTKEIENDDEVIKPVNLNLEIVYEDDDILLINKPKGLVVHPATSYQGTTLVHGLLYHTNKLSNLNGDDRPGIVHRLDRDTSGLMIIAKTNEAHEILAHDFKMRNIEKYYYAIVSGTFDESTATINMPIKRDEFNRLKMAVNKEGRNAVTHFSVKEQYLRHALLDIDLETGRTHQIRVHLSHIKHPILSDIVYGHKKPYDDYGQYLHAYKLTFNHPIKKEQMTFELPLPSKFIETIKNLA